MTRYKKFLHSSKQPTTLYRIQAMNTGIRLLVFLSIAILSSSYEIHIKNSNSTLNIQIYGQDGGVLLSNKEIGASQSISGTLRIPQDVYGCNITETFSETDIVLVLRGNCEFATKVYFHNTFFVKTLCFGDDFIFSLSRQRTSNRLMLKPF